MIGDSDDRDLVHASQRDEIRATRAAEFHAAAQRSAAAIAKEPPDFASAFIEMWRVFRTFQMQMFEVEGLTIHWTTVLASIDKRTERMDREKRAPLPSIDPDGTVRHRSDDLEAVQRQLDHVAQEAKNDSVAIAKQVDKVWLTVGAEPKPEGATEEERKGTGMRRQIAILFSLRSMALLVIAAAVGGGGLLAVVFELIKELLPKLLH